MPGMSTAYNGNLPTQDEVDAFLEDQGIDPAKAAADAAVKGTPAVGAPAPDITATSSMTADIGVQTPAEKQLVKEGLQETLLAPKLPAGSELEVTKLKEGDIQGQSQFLDADDQGSFASGDYKQVQGAVASGAKTATPGLGDTKSGGATYEASTIGDVGSTDAANGSVSKEVQALQGGLSQEAQAAQGVVDPDSLAQAATGQVTERVQAATTDPNQFAASTVDKPEVTKMDPVAMEAAKGQASLTDIQSAVDQMGYETAVAEAAKAGNLDAFLINQPAEMVAAQMQTVKGEAAKGVAAQIDIDAALANLNDQPAQMQAVVAALPEEALVTSQMDDLLAGLEGGNIPAWARPAVDNVENMLAARGLGKSSIARDQLFNAIISSAMPIAQSNATALQQRASENLGYQNRAEEINANLRQQLGMQLNDKVANFVAMNAQLQQDMEVANMNAAQQMELANLEYEFNTNRENMSAENAARLQNIRNQMETDAANADTLKGFASQDIQNQQQTNILNSQFAQQSGMAQSDAVRGFLSENTQLLNQMEQANLSAEQQARMANLETEFQTNRENMSAENVAELESMRADLQVELTNQQIASNLGLANLSNEQQAAVQNAQNVLNMDLANMSNEQQAQLVNSQFMQTMTVTNLSNQQQAVMQNAANWAAMDQANLSAGMQAQVQNAQNFLSMDLANLNNDQQAIMLDSQQRFQGMLQDSNFENAAKQFNATSENEVAMFRDQMVSQITQFNAAQMNAMAQFNVSQKNDMRKFNGNIEFMRDQFNASMYAQIQNSNVEWTRNINTIDTAAENTVNQINAANKFGMSMKALDFFMQDMRDSANNYFTSQENRKAQDAAILAQAALNEGNADTAMWASFGKLAAEWLAN